PVGSITLTAELVARGPAAAFVLDDEQVAIVGKGAKRFPARATINGAVLRTTVAKMRGEYLFGLSRAAREQAGIAAGDTVTFTLELDTEPRTVAVPDALTAALDADPRARTAFDALAHTHRKEFARWVSEAKREETRDRRITQALEMLREGKTRS
ncbi:MAG: YdeI/OmpD-associated family protein, partial [Solirubrobacteraceae bacterium]